MSATHTSQCLSVSDLLDRAACAINGEDFSALVRRASRGTEECAEFDDCFIELRARLHRWLDEPPATVAAGHVAFAFIDFVERFTPEDGSWYPVHDHERFADVVEWFCEDCARLSDIEEGTPDLIPGHTRSSAQTARALLTRLHPHVADMELLDA